VIKPVKPAHVLALVVASVCVCPAPAEAAAQADPLTLVEQATRGESTQATPLVPQHNIDLACGTLMQLDDIEDCIRAERLHYRYILGQWYFLTFDKQRYAAEMMRRFPDMDTRYYRELSKYIESHVRQRRPAD
jgi:hypothetical protein